jgi:hypothetical protein
MGIRTNVKVESRVGEKVVNGFGRVSRHNGLQN